MTILRETCLALLLLGGNVVGDEGVVALLAEGVLALHLLLVDSLLDLHQLLDTPHVLLLFLRSRLLLSGVQLWLGWILICFRISAGIRTHGVSELIEQSCVLSPASHNLPGDRLLLGVGLSVELLLLLPLLEVLLLLQIVVLLLVVVELLWLLVIELLLWLLDVDDG